MTAVRHLEFAGGGVVDTSIVAIRCTNFIVIGIVLFKL